jgi:ribosomal protein S18 acetylase RimI-like enzyme
MRGCFLFISTFLLFIHSAHAVAVKCQGYLYTNPMLIVDRTVQFNHLIRVIDDDEDIPRLVQIAENAFSKDTLYSYLAPDESRRASYFETIIRHGYEKGKIIADATNYEKPTSFAIWMKSSEAFANPYERYHNGQVHYFRQIPFMKIFDILRWEQYVLRVRRTLAYDDAAYLWMVAVSPEFQRDGLGARLIEPVLSTAMQNGRTPIVLEAYTNEQIAYFERFGFKVEHSEQPYHKGPPVAFMVWRH